MKARQYFTHGLVDSTQRIYSAPQRQYLAFCSRLDLSLFPASEQTLMLFITELASRIQPQSIPVYLSAIRALHIAHGYPNPLDDTLQLRQTVRGINRLHGITAKQKLAITIELLGDMKQFISLSSHDDYVKWSAMVTAHFFLLRCSEFTVLHPKDFRPDRHLTRADVQFRTSPDGTEFMALRLKTSKTDQVRRSHTLFFGYSKSDICPVCCLQTLIRHYNPSSHDYNTTPLFALQDGSPLTRLCLLSFSSSRLRLLGIDPTLFGGHSFRIGGATSAGNAGIPDHLIKPSGAGPRTVINVTFVLH